MGAAELAVFSLIFSVVSSYAYLKLLQHYAAKAVSVILCLLVVISGFASWYLNNFHVTFVDRLIGWVLGSFSFFLLCVRCCQTASLYVAGDAIEAACECFFDVPAMAFEPLNAALATCL